MHRVRVLLIATFCFGCVCAAVDAFDGGDVVAQGAVHLEMNASRKNSSDLEVRGVGKPGSHYVTRESLAALPQVEAVVRQDENFTEMPKDGVTVRGVPLDALCRALGVPATAVAEAMAADGYAATYPAEYRKQHQPIFVLTVDGTTPEAWAEETHTSDQGPYFIAYDNFVPAFRVLSHQDRSQLPVQVVRLGFAPEKMMFAGILPSGAADLSVTQGFRIAQQNCFRCHDAAGYGGVKARRNWQLLAKDARERPAWFAKWVHDPRSVDRSAEMPANPQYDRATLTALTRYFSTMYQSKSMK